MKKYLKFFLISILAFGFIAVPPKAIYASGDIKVLLEGKELSFDVPPQIIEGRTLLPLRAIFEALGLEVGWDDATKTITGTVEGKEIVLKLDSKDAKINGEHKTLDVPAKVVNGRTLVPVRFIAESLDMNVVWNQNERTILITGQEDIGEYIDTFDENSATRLSENRLYLKHQNIGYLVNNKGDIIREISSKYIIGNYSEGLASFSEYKGDENQWKKGFVDKEGNIIIDAKYDHVYDFNEGVAWVGKHDKDSYKLGRFPMIFGAIDKSGKFLIPYKYTKPNFTASSGAGELKFSEGRAVVFVNEYGLENVANGFIADISCKYIDINDKDYTHGKKVREPSFHFSEGLAYIEYSTGEPYTDSFRRFTGYVDKDFNEVIDLREAIEGIEFEDHSAYVESGEGGLKSYNLNNYNIEHFFSEGLARFKIGLVSKEGGSITCYQFGYINKDGEVMISPNYINAGNFSEGLAFVNKGYYRANVTYNITYPDGTFVAKRIENYVENDLGYIDKQGNVVIDLPKEIVFAGDFNEGMAPVAIKKGDAYLWGFINREGKQVIPTEFTNVYPFSEGYARVDLADGTCKFIDKNGNYLRIRKGIN
ncbi:copper amine oxidase domain-containing protein [Proteiniborus sp. DW1]|uniref:WG repeat-containing protein n=1 Tax=Proteiniborus sp. DW1 TaxID=1889883 RepID=UPI00092DFECE|nr:WG repeat-containing protein [Proteiniborus sp. DW1]SCG84344.1 copper amine oxidase domain-containing protein [Proteiniborus sp. DW1]